MTGALEVRGLSKSYGSLQALKNMSFTVNPGEVFGFVGSNGAGKTTTMRIILGVLASDGGEVLLGGTPIDLAIRREIGYMPEERGLYPRMKVADQLIYLAMLHGMDRETATDSMERWTERLGVASRRGDEVQKLSLGNQQRVQLAAALVHEPNLLVLDEPFSGLDPIAVDVMSGVLRERADQGVPVIFSSHQLDLMDRICDTVGIVRGGEMVESGSIASLRRSGRARWAIDAPDATNGWLDAVPGVSVVSVTGTRSVIELADGVDSQGVLRAALATGPVLEFAQVLPTLTDLFRDVVSHVEGEPAESGVGAPAPSNRRRSFGRGGRSAA